MLVSQKYAGYANAALPSGDAKAAEAEAEAAGGYVGDDVPENGIGSQDVRGREEGAALTNSRGGGGRRRSGAHDFDVMVVAGIKVLDGHDDVLGESDGVEGGEDEGTREGG